MIKIKKEPEDFKHLPAEICIFCKEETRYWYDDGEIAICPECAKIHSPEELQKEHK